MADNPDLLEGEQGEWVTYLQQLLERSGHPPGAEDGWFGPKTASAVRAFQEASGRTADGLVGQQTWGLLEGGVPAADTSATDGDQPAADAEGEPKLGLRITAAELDSCDVPEMEEEAV